MGDGTTIKEWVDAALELNKANKQAPANIADMVDAPVVLARPFIEHAMMSAVLTVAGQDTGATLFGPSDMQLSANTAVKTIEGACNKSCSLKSGPAWKPFAPVA
jgi:hypothetical protein